MIRMMMLRQHHSVGHPYPVQVTTRCNATIYAFVKNSPRGVPLYMKIQPKALTVYRRLNPRPRISLSSRTRFLVSPRIRFPVRLKNPTLPRVCVRVCVYTHACACTLCVCVRMPARAHTRTRGFFTYRSVHVSLQFVCELWGFCVCC